MKKLKNALLVALLLSLTSCISALTRDDGAGETPAEETPSARAARANRVTLVLGGAGVASYATVGLLKKLYEEGVEVELIVATGWPAVFALANGYLKSIHDLEWFATRLDKKDFDRMGSVDFRRDIDPSEAIPAILTNSFSQTLLNQSRVPVILAATNTDLGEPDVFGTGEWKEPLLRTVSMPGIYRRFPSDRGTGWIDAISGLDVREALRRGSANILAVSMYDDYLSWVTLKKDDELVRRVYANQLRKTTQEALKQASLSSSIQIQKEPTDYGAKRSAIQAGYREGARLIKKLREQAGSTAN